jgi:CYTH domain-containing protein/thymidylate kinase
MKRKPSIHKIVITGGPCAGKTTALSWIQNAFSQRGYAVLFLSEVATELITGGIAPWTCQSNGAFQCCQLRMQLEKERIYQEAALCMKAEKVLVVCDRGAMDNRAYMTEEEFHSILAQLGKSEVELRDNYDAVFHLVTAAKGAEDYYTLENNAARRESPEEAQALDDRIIAAWAGHPHLRVIDNSSGFEEKMVRLIREISSFLGEPEPMEVERKFLIAYPDLAQLEAMPHCQKVDIMQTYLKAPAGEETRVRQRGCNGSYIYFKTTKRRISHLKRVEIEERLGQAEYLSLLMEADPDYRPIHKTRYCLVWHSQYFEIDVYPFWQDQAIVEIELSQEGDPVEFPDFLQVIREVTQEEDFTNRALARVK